MSRVFLVLDCGRMLRTAAIFLLATLSACQAASPDSPKGQSAKQHNDVAALGRLEPRDPVTEVGVSSDDRLGKLLFVKGNS